MGTFIEPVDLAPFADIDAAKAAAMIQDAEAQAILTAPCITSLTVAPEDETAEAAALRTAKVAAVVSILRAALLRWHEAGSGVIQTESTGPFSKTTQYQGRRAMFWPSEITDLQGICKDADGGKIFSVDVYGADSAHLPWCSLNFGATYCSCGVDIAGYPIFEA
jgi:hypothetical protein